MKSLKMIAVALLFMFVSTSTQGQQTTLHYKAPEQVQYSVKITVDFPDETNTYQGHITYQGSMGGSDTLALTFKGGLKKSTKKKQSARSSRPFDDPFGGRRPFEHPAFTSPFARPSGPGSLRQTSAKLTMSSTGEILSLEGDSQLPLPLGHLSLLVFEALPDKATSNWSTTNGVMIGKSRSPSSGFGFPRDPLARSTRPSKTSAGSETARFTVKGTSGSRITIDKKYELDSPNSKPPFELTGGGSLVFDRDQGLFASADLDYQLTIDVDNVSAAIPVTVEYHRMTAAEIATVQREATEAAAKAAKAASEAKAAEAAKYAEMSEEQVTELYRVGEPVPPTRLAIPPEIRLPKGLIVQNKWPYHEKWSPAKVVQELPDGKIEFESIKLKKLYQRARDTLTLAPDFIDQPYVAKVELEAFRRQLAGEAPPPPEFRTWKDATGKFSIEAEYVTMDGGNVVLRRKEDNRELKIPLTRLSQPDQQFVSQLQGSSDDNPFNN